MPILNYTTSIDANKTLAEIQAMLAKAGAQAIMLEYDDQQNPSSVSFRIKTAHGLLNFQLPAKVESVYKVMLRDAKIPKSQRTMAQAARVSWRIVKDWLAAQLAFVEAGLVEVSQVFLAFMQNAQGETLYESLERGGFNGLAIQDRKPAQP